MACNDGSGLGGVVGAPRPVVTLGDLLDCLRPLRAADINFCPALGLDVHGNQLYVLLGTPISIATGHTWAERLRVFAAKRWLDWQARRRTARSTSLRRSATRCG